jgi:hypothetical protein
LILHSVYASFVYLIAKYYEMFAFATPPFRLIKRVHIILNIVNSCFSPINSDPEWHFSYKNDTKCIVVSDYIVKMDVMQYFGILLPNTGYTWTEGIATHFIFSILFYKYIVHAF